MKKFILALEFAVVLLAFPMTVHATDADPAQTADENQTDESIVDTTIDENSENPIVAGESKPFLSLGNDLSDEQLSYVLGEMGISKENLDEYRVIYITNDMEHQYLDAYLDPEVIGSYSLSSVMVKENTEGTGIRVTTKNINYCTISMYKNALLTAGVENAEVLVVGPFPISGTAALIGAWQAYEEMTGEELSEEAKKAALAEMITIGDITEEVSEEDKETVSELIDYIKAEVIAEGLTDAKDILEVIEEAQSKFDITLNDEQIKMIQEVMGEISKLDIDPKKLLEQAGDLYDKYGETVLSEAKAAIDGIFTDEVKASLWDSIKSFFRTLIDALKSYIAS